MPRNFNPRPPQGERRVYYLLALEQSYFNPRPPQGERRANRWRVLVYVLHFNPRPPQGERRHPDLTLDVVGCISIHAPRKGSDAL